MRQRLRLLLNLASTLAVLLATVLSPAAPAEAAAELTVTPITWNVVGLDSNDPMVGPQNFPVSARVCNTGDETAHNVTFAFVWDTAHDYINLRPGSYGLPGNPYPTLDSLDSGDCVDIYFEVQVTRDPAAFDTTAGYHITADSDETAAASTPTPREIYVEHLISQSRNSTTDVQLKVGGVYQSVPAGGTMTLMVGSTYDIRLIGATATNGYEQIETFVNFLNTVFRVNSVTTTYTAPPGANSDLLYGDACTWENDPTSLNYRSCLGVGKLGGNIRVDYNVTIIGGGGTSQMLHSLIYDFSGSSYHYNSDYAFGARIARIVNATITKSFAPKSINPGGTSALTFTITNPGTAALTGVNFTDILPANVSIADTTITYTSCGTPSPASLAAGQTSLSFTNISVAALSTCTIAVSVTGSTDGTYNNTSGHLLVGTADTESYATDTLLVTSKPAPPSSCPSPVTLATWDFTTGTNPTILQPDVAYAIAAYSATGTSGVAAGYWWGRGWIAIDNPAPPPPASSDTHFQFDIDTSNYGGVAIQTSARINANQNWNGNTNNLRFWESADSAPFSLAGTDDITLSTTWLTFGRTVTATGTTHTRFRVQGYYVSKTQGAAGEVWLDNVTITGCPRPQLPTLSKSFLTSPIARGGTSTLRFALTNPNAAALTGVGLSDTLPTGLLIATPNGLATACTAGSLTAGTMTADPGTTTISLTGATLSANANCTISVNVLGNVAGQYTNVSGSITSSETGPNTTSSGYGTSSLTVVAPPIISKSFTANPIFTGDSTDLAFSIINPNTATQLTGVAFTDVLPAGLTVADGSTTGCGGTVTTTAATRTVALSGGTIAAGGTCTLSVPVTGSTAGLKQNSVTITSTEGGTGNTATADVLVRDPVAALSFLKQVGPTASGPWANYLEVNLPASIYYRLTVENIGDIALTGVVVTDPEVDTSGCGYPVALPVATAANENHVDTCIVGPIPAVLGSQENTATADSNETGPVSDDATYLGIAAPTIVKVFNPDSITVGGTSQLTLTLGNTNGMAATLAADFVDTLPANLIIATPNGLVTSCPGIPTAPAGGSTITYPSGALIPPTGCTIQVNVTSSTIGTHTNSIAAWDLVTNLGSNPAPASDDLVVTAILPPSISKSFAPDPIIVGGTSSLTFVITNPNAGVAFTGVAFTDTLPAGLSVASASIAECGGTLTTTAPSTIELSGGSISAASFCSFSVAVTGASAGVHSNVSGNVTSSEGGPGNTASDTITVIAPPAIAKSFAPDPIAVGGISTLSFTLTNPAANTVALTGVAFTDALPGGLQVAALPNASTSACGTPTFAPVAGDTTLSFSDGAIAVGGTCTVNVDLTATSAGIKINTSGAVNSTNGGTGNTASDSLTVSAVLPPSISKSFAPDPIAIGGTSTLSFTLTNPNPGIALTGVAFSDTLPTGLSVASATTPECGGTLTTTSPVTIDLSGASIAASGTCTFDVTVTGVSAGLQSNVSGNVASNEGGAGGTATDTITVIGPPTIAKAFAPASIPVGGASTLTFTLTNPAANTVALTGVAFSDDLPTGVQVASPPNASTLNCGSPTFAPVATDTTLTFSSGTIAVAGTCTVSVDVTATSAGAKNNTSGNVTSANGGTGNTASDTLTVSAVLPPSISKSFAPDPIAVGGTSSLTFVITNSNPGAVLAGVAFTDTLPAGLTITAGTSAECGGTLTATAPASIELSGGAIAAASSCSFSVSVSGATPGLKSNTTSLVYSSNGGTGNAASDDLTVTSVAPTVAKVFNPDSITAGGASRLTLSFGNTNAVAATLTADFIDTLPVNVVVANPASVGGTCTGTVTATPGTSTITYASGSLIPDVGCTIEVDVTSSTVGTHTNSIAAGDLVTNLGNNPGAASDDLTVTSVAAPALNLTKSVTSLGPFDSVGDPIDYELIATNTGNVPLTGVTISDPLLPLLSCVPAQPANLAVGATLTCTGSHPITQADLDSATVTNTATADSIETGPDTAGTTTNLTQTPALSIVKSAAPATYDSVGDVINYSYLVTNSGNVTLTGPFTVADDHATDETCPVTASLAPGASVTCFASHAITQPDLDNGSVTNTAAASGVFGLTPVTSPPDSETVTATQTPAIQVVKEVSVDGGTSWLDANTPPGPSLASGTDPWFQFTVTNTGNVTLTGLTLTDSDFTLSACTPPASLAPAASFACSVTPAWAAGQHTDTATATGSFGGSTYSDTDEANYFGAGPDLDLTKTVTSPGPYDSVGDLIAYQMIATNVGNTPLTGVTISDPLLGVLLCAPAQPAALAVGDALTCSGSYPITQADLDSGTVTNTATADSIETGPDTAGTTTNLTQTPALSIVKSAAPATYDSVGDVINYSYLVTNSGNVTLTGPFTVADDHATDETCPVAASLAPGASITCTASHTIGQVDLDAGSVTNVASASNGTVTSPTDTETATAMQSPAIQVVKSVSPDGGTSWFDANTPPGPSIPSGTDPQFQFRVTNTGNVTLTGLTLSDSDYSTASCVPPPASLAPGATFTCTITAAWAFGLQTDTATAGGRFGVTPVSDSDDANYTGTAATISDPGVTKSGDPGTASVGDIVTFTLVVTNNGTANADGVTLTDPIPAFLDIVNVSVAPPIPPGDIDITGNTITIDFGTLTPGQTYTVTIVTVVNSLGAPPGGTNTASVSTTSADSDPANNASAALTTIVAGGAAPATGFAPDRITRLPAQPANRAYTDYGDLWLEIPTLSVKLPIVGVPLTEDGWDVTWLGRQAGWLNSTAFPTWKGNSVLTSHVTLASGRPGPFRNLKTLRWDDAVVIHYAGQRYMYAVRSTSAVAADDASIFRHEERPWLTLVTCGGYDEASGEYRYRIVVRAVLLSIEPEP